MSSDSGSFKNVINKLFVYKSYVFNVYMYKQDLVLDNLQDWHAIKPNRLLSD